MSERTKSINLYINARKKRARGEPLTYAERQRLDQARDIRVARKEATERKDRARELAASDIGPCFRKTRFGWRVVVPNDFPGGPWSARDAIEIVRLSGGPQWVTLIELKFTGGDHRRSEWWTFVKGRQSQVMEHKAVPFSAPELPPLRVTGGNCVLDEDDDDEGEGCLTTAGRAYLVAARMKGAKSQP